MAAIDGSRFARRSTVIWLITAESRICTSLNIARAAARLTRMRPGVTASSKSRSWNVLPPCVAMILNKLARTSQSEVPSAIS